MPVTDKTPEELIQYKFIDGLLLGMAIVFLIDAFAIWNGWPS